MKQFRLTNIPDVRSRNAVVPDQSLFLNSLTFATQSGPVAISYHSQANQLDVKMTFADGVSSAALDLLPPGYGHQPVNDLSPLPGARYRVTVKRRVPYISLPFTSSSQPAAIREAQAKVTRATSHDLQLPGHSSLSVRVVEKLRAAKASRQQHFETALLESKNGCLRITITQAIPGNVDCDKQAFRGLIHPLLVEQLELNPKQDSKEIKPDLREIKPEYFRHRDALRYTFRMLQSDLLHTVVIEAFADTPEGATAIALAFASRHGGVKAYEISPPESCELKATETHFGQPGLAPEYSDVRGPSSAAIKKMYGNLRTYYESSEVARFCRLPVGPVVGMQSHPTSPFTESHFAGRQAARSIFLGLHGTPECLPCPGPDATIDHPLLQDAASVTIDVMNLVGHMLLLGHVGTGKSYLLDSIIEQAAKHDKLFTVIDPASQPEHHQKLTQAGLNPKRFTLQYPEIPGQNFDGKQGGLRLDMLRIPCGISMQAHASNLLTYFASLFNLHRSLLSFFELGLREYYIKACGLTNATLGSPDILCIDGDEVWPSLRTFVAYFLKVYIPKMAPVGSRASTSGRDEWTAYFDTKLKCFMQSPSGQMCAEADAVTSYWMKANPDASPEQKTFYYDPFHEFMRYSSVLELAEAGSEDDKNSIMLLIVMLMSEHLAANYHEKRGNVKFNRLLVIEEAHRVLGQTSTGGRGDIGGDDPKALSSQFLINAMAELRKTGLAVILNTQLLRRLNPAAADLVDNIIAFRTKSSDNFQLLKTAMSLSAAESAYVTKLDKGNAVVMSPGFAHPLLTIIPSDIPAWINKRSTNP